MDKPRLESSTRPKRRANSRKHRPYASDVARYPSVSSADNLTSMLVEAMRDRTVRTSLVSGRPTDGRSGRWSVIPGSDPQIEICPFESRSRKIGSDAQDRPHSVRFSPRMI